ncbi:MAG: GDP-L-fucose synthase [Chlamydiales bacterium]|nr:GDP-L-fucose synthase [Chlamydiales bacterium]MCH9634825.1 GDP-L-fucose synthase [Chlamydiales bacterium]MCH9703770.1 GDP-L-fucose synthase [Chlamydiota bacterium]
MQKRDRILVLGGSGMVGSAFLRLLRKEGFANLLAPSHTELDLLDQAAVRAYMSERRPDVVLVAAARVGGIHANSTYPAQFLYENMMIASLVIHEAYLAKVPRLLYLGSTCIYPREATQPICEEELLTKPLEKSNEAYALAKICGVKLCEFYRQQYGCDYISAMPTNLYGIGDQYHPENSHVIPGMIRRFVEAKASGAESVTIWGSGTPLREFLYVDDLAKALLFLLRNYHESGPINVGADEEFSIAEVAQLVKEAVGFEGRLEYDRSKPDGTPRKKSDCSKLHQMGWRASTPFLEGLRIAVADFEANVAASVCP